MTPVLLTNLECCVVLLAPGVKLVLTLSSIFTHLLPLYLNSLLGTKSNLNAKSPMAGFRGKLVPGVTLSPLGATPSPVK